MHIFYRKVSVVMRVTPTIHDSTRILFGRRITLVCRGIERDFSRGGGGSFLMGFKKKNLSALISALTLHIGIAYNTPPPPRGGRLCSIYAQICVSKSK